MTDETRVEEIKQYSKEWYTIGRSLLPEFSDFRFMSFAGTSNAFSYQVNPKARHITIRLTKACDTAYVDLMTNTIFISEKYFDSKLYSERFGDDGTEDIERLAIALVNGSVIHEALHIKFTTITPSIEGLLEDNYRYGKMKEKYGKQVCCMAFNIIEDLYIEANVSKQLEEWLQSCSDILFSESDLEDIDSSLEQMQDYLNLAVMYKNKALRKNEIFESFPSKALEILEKVSLEGETMQSVRINATFDFLECFEGELPEASDDGEGQNGEGSASEAMGEILDSLEGMTDEEFEKMAAEMAEASDKTAKESRTIKSHIVGHSECEWQPMEECEVFDAPLTDDDEYYERDLIEPQCKINFNFLKELVAVRTLNRTIGAARKQGSVMVKSRLTRIATDGKIFAKLDAQRKQLKRMEIIINIDLSGSTGGRVVNNEVGAAMEISKVLRAANIAHSVYGHTSRDNYIPLLIHVFSHDMKENNQDWDKRFEALLPVRLEQNFDGVIIKELENKFTERNATRYIINLSDGSPAAPGYSGMAANDHTKNEIENLRKKGIHVFAISVVEHVVRYNSAIYGEEFNIDASKNLQAQFRTLIRKLVGA